MNNGDGYIQIGDAALRDMKTGMFQSSVPLYIRASDEAIRSLEPLLDEFISKAINDNLPE